MNEKLKEKVKESLSSVLPITLIVLVLSVTLVPMEIGTLALRLIDGAYPNYAPLLDTILAHAWAWEQRHGAWVKCRQDRP